jgi:hypothetical protein
MSSAIANALHHSPPLSATFSHQQILQVANGTSVDIAKWVCEAAAERGVAVRRDALDVFADAVSRLSDAEVELDPVEELMIALRRAGVISPYQRGLLQVSYLRQLRRVQ